MIRQLSLVSNVATFVRNPFNVFVESAKNGRSLSYLHNNISYVPGVDYLVPLSRVLDGFGLEKDP